MIPPPNGILIGSAILQSTVQVVGITGVPNSTQTETAEHGNERTNVYQPFVRDYPGEPVPER